MEHTRRTIHNWIEGTDQGYQAATVHNEENIRCNDAHLRKKNAMYDFIIGRDILQSIGIDIINSKQAFKLGDIEIKMVPRGYFAHASETSRLETMFNNEPETRIKDANYKKADLQEVANKQTHLTTEQRKLFLAFLKRHEVNFQGKRGEWKGETVYFELKDNNSRPVQCRPYQVPHSLLATTKKEVT